MLRGSISGWARAPVHRCDFVGQWLVVWRSPSLSASNVNVSDLLRRGGMGRAGTPSRARNGLIVTEVALSVILLAGAGLLIRSYLNVQKEDKGFASSTLTM